MEDDQCRVFRRLAGERWQVCAQIAFDYPRLLLMGNRDCCAQSCQAIRLFWPYQCLQPSYLAGVREIDRLEIQSRPPRHFRQCFGYWCRGIDLAGKHRWWRTLRFGSQDVSAIVVRIEVGEQTETGRRAHFEQG